MSPTGAGPRHAEVVPSFVLPLLSPKKLSSRVGPVEPWQLLRWERPGDLAATWRSELRGEVINRLRRVADELWQAPVGVHLVDGWERNLLPSEQEALRNWQGAHGAFAEQTLRQLKDQLHQPLDRLLSLLARVESTYWVVPPAPLHRAQRPEAPRAPIPLDDSLRTQVERVLALQWLPVVRPEDPRFPCPSGEPLSGWLAAQLERPAVDHRLPGLLDALEQADALNVQQEARALALWAASAARERQPKEEVAARWADILLARHLSPEGEGKTLVEVGDAFEVTRERIRQMCERMQEVLAEAQPAAPALSRLLDEAARIAPCSIADANDRLQRLLGEAAGIESALGWARVVGNESLPVHCDTPKFKVRGQAIDVQMLLPVEAAPWVTAAVRHASKDCSVMGCTNLIRVAGQLALNEGLAPGRDALASALSGATGFRWLDEGQGWFTLGDSAACATANRVRKVMAVARTAVGADQLCAALASDDIWLYREQNSAAVPPPHVLRELLRGWTFLRVVQKGRFEALEPLKLEEELSASERIAVAVIESRGGVACRFEVKEAIAKELELTDVAVSSMLGSSPIIVKLELGLYALLGRQTKDSATEAARGRLRARYAKEGVSTPQAGDRFLLQVTDASLRNEQYAVPVRHQDVLSEGTFRMRSPFGVDLGLARVNASGVMTKLNCVLPGIAAGKFIQVVVLPGPELEVCLIEGGAPASAETQAVTADQTSRDSDASAVPGS